MSYKLKALYRRVFSSKSKTNGLWLNIKTIIFGVLIALGIRTFLYEPFTIPSGSMIPTLLIGDYMFVSKMSYGLSQYSFPFSLGPIQDRILDTPPKRGDVVVFRQPTNTDIDFVKRLIGMPGDTIKLISGVVHINGEAVKRRRINDYQLSKDIYNKKNVRHYIETLPNGVEYAIIEADGDRGYLDNTQEYIVPAGHFFLMGDNRDQSNDSRVLSQVGYVPYKNLIGRADLVFVSIDSNPEGILPILLRFSRFFKVIH